MIADKFLWMVKGYVTIEISGNSVERFVNLCCNRKIRLWNCRLRDNHMIADILVHDFKMIRQIVRKTHSHIKILSKKGLPFLMYRKRKHLFFVYSIALFVVIIYIMSSYVWNITLEGGYTYTESEIVEFLKTKKICHGIRKKSINCDEIEKMIRNEYFDITWVSVELTGTNLIVHIKENFDTLKTAEEMKNSNLVATKDALITQIITRKGTPLMHIGDKVKKGDIIVSGEISVLNDNKEVAESYYVCADADVYGKVNYTYNKEFSMTYTKKLYTGEFEDEHFVKIGSLRLGTKLLKKYKCYDSVSDNSQLCMFDNFYLPIYWGKERKKEYEYSECVYQKEEAYKIAQNELENFLKKLDEKGVQIVSNNVKIKVSGNRCTAKGSITAIERIAVSSEITAKGNDD